jgi:hypothetical protein
MDAAEKASPQAVEDAPEPPALEIPELESSLEEEEDVVDSSAAESAEEDDSGVFEPILEEPEEERPAYSPDTLPISPVLPEAAEDEDDFRNPIAQAVKDASGEEEEASGSDVDHVEAVTDSSQKITLTRMVSSGNTGRIKTRAPEEGSDASGPVLPPTKAPSLPPEEVEPSEEAKQQQEMLQLEPTSGKGRFAKTDPTIVDGEDLDVPTFLRKK